MEGGWWAEEMQLATGGFFSSEADYAWNILNGDADKVVSILYVSMSAYTDKFPQVFPECRKFPLHMDLRSRQMMLSYKPK